MKTNKKKMDERNPAFSKGVDSQSINECVSGHWGMYLHAHFHENLLPRHNFDICPDGPINGVQLANGLKLWPLIVLAVIVSAMPRRRRKR